MTTNDTTAAGYTRLQIKRLGLWLFILSESMLFIGLAVARFTLQGIEVHEHLSQVIGLAITTVLLASSYTAFRAERAASDGDRAGLQRFLVLTLALGAVFVGGVVVEWSAALEHFPPSSGFGTVFFSMTGAHAFHVLTGLLFLGIVYGRARAGEYSSTEHFAVEAGVKYWHFVDVVWVFFYPALYLVS